MDGAVLLVLLVGSIALMWWAWFQAIKASRGHPPFDEAVGARRHVGYDAIKLMPDRAKPYVRMHFAALAVFFFTPLFLMLGSR